MKIKEEIEKVSKEVDEAFKVIKEDIQRAVDFVERISEEE